MKQLATMEEIEMAFSEIELDDINKKIGAYVSRIRPKPEIRSKLDIAYKIYDQSVEIYEIREAMNGGKLESPIAKTTYVRKDNAWKVFWMRQDLKWHGYDTKSVKSISKFIELVEKDEFCCFWG